MRSGVDCGKNSDALVSGLHSETKRSEKDVAYFHDTFLWAPGQIETIMRETIAIGCVEIKFTAPSAR